MIIKNFLKSLLLATLLSGTVAASDWYDQQIAGLQKGIIDYEQMIVEETELISQWEANMITIGYSTPESETNNAYLQRSINAAYERISHRRSVIADSERAIERYRDAQRRELSSQSRVSSW